RSHSRSSADVPVCYRRFLNLRMELFGALRTFHTQPVWKSAIQQVWKPALQLAGCIRRRDSKPSFSGGLEAGHYRNAMTDPRLTFENQKEWETWLDRNGSSSSGVWLRLAKKASGHSTVSYAEAVETALCFGWIDGQKRTENERFWLQRF